MVRGWIEFHDSVLRSVATDDGRLFLELDAYVHRWEQRDSRWLGTGWIQPVTIMVRKATTPVATIETPVDVWDGSIRVDEAVYINRVPLPFEGTGAVRVVMEVINGALIEIVGEQMTLAATGDARFVEDLPADLLPPNLKV
jgi:hypothetical protein